MFLPFQDLTLWQLINRLVAFVIVTAIHGAALAGMARLLGDPTPQRQGRLTLNPFAHLSLIATIMALLFRLGWITPMRLDAARLRFGRAGVVVCALVSLLVTLALVPALSPLRSLAAANLSLTTGQTVLILIDTTQDIALWFVAFNIFPVPPLTGGLILAAAWPDSPRVLNRPAWLPEAVMVALIVVGAVGLVVTPLANALHRALPY